MKENISPVSHPTPKEPKKKEGKKSIQSKGKVASLAQAATLTAALIGAEVQPLAAAELSSPPPSPSQGSHLILKQGMPSEQAWNEQIASQGEALQGRETVAEVSRPITETYANLLVTEEWLKQNPQTIAAAFDVKDQDGKLLKKLVVVKKDPDGTNTKVENILYEAPYDQTTQVISTEWKPKSKVPIANVKSMTALQKGKIIYVGGETPFISGNTALVRSANYGETGTWGQNLWASSGLTAVSGATLDLIPINETTGYGNNSNYEGGVGQFIIYDNDSGTNAPRIAAVTELISATNLRSAGAPEITASYSLTSTIVVTSSAFERGLERGVDKSTINYQNATGRTDNFLADEVGYVIGITEYQDASGGKNGLVSGADFDYKIKGFPIDANGNPGHVNYSIDFRGWLNDKNIENFIPDSLSVESLFAGADTQGNVHIWFFGQYGVTRSDNFWNSNHAMIGHYIKGTNPNTDSNALFWKDLGPFDRNHDTMPPSQRQLKFKIVNGQYGLEFPVDGEGFFGGLEFFPINSDYSPMTNTEKVLPNKGLQKLLDIIRLFIPIVFRKLTGASW